MQCKSKVNIVLMGFWVDPPESAYNQVKGKIGEYKTEVSL
jgi:hypothetical protein